jgi:hypothetical protein
VPDPVGCGRSEKGNFLSGIDNICKHSYITNGGKYGSRSGFAAMKENAAEWQVSMIEAFLDAPVAKQSHL